MRLDQLKLFQIHKTMIGCFVKSTNTDILVLFMADFKCTIYTNTGEFKSFIIKNQIPSNQTMDNDSHELSHNKRSNT